MEPPVKRTAESEVEPFKRAKIEPVTVTVADMLNAVSQRLRQTPEERKLSLKEEISKRLKEMTCVRGNTKSKDPC